MTTKHRERLQPDTSSLYPISVSVPVTARLQNNRVKSVMFQVLAPRAP